VVTRIRKETKAKLKEVVKEATRRLDGDTERMFEQALHTIVRHYDSVAGTASADNGSEAPATDAPTGKGKRGRKKGPTLNKDGTPRKPRTARNDADDNAAPASTPGKRGRKPSSATAAKPATTGAKRGPKPRNQAALATDNATAETSVAAEVPAAAPATPSRSTAKKPAAKPATKAAPKRAAATAAVTPEPEAGGLLNSADSASTGEVSE